MAPGTDTRGQIMDLGFQLILQRGFDGFSYRDISEPLGVRNAAIHYHFPSKMDLVKALIEENHRVLRESTAEFMAYGGPARPQLEGLFQFTLDQYQRGYPICMAGALAVNIENLSEGTRKKLDRLMEDTVNWLARVLETGRDQDEFRFRGDAKSKALSILAMTQGARQLARVHGKEYLERVFDQIRTDLDLVG